MAVPKRKTSKSKKNMRRSHDSLSSPPRSTCPQCGAPKVPHRVCASCGVYKGQTVIDVDAD